LNIVPVAPIFTSWNNTAFPTIPEDVRSMPGFLASVFQIRVKVPAAAAGVQRSLLYLKLPNPSPASAPPLSNAIGIYVTPATP
jgi:hypothetical protein